MLPSIPTHSTIEKPSSTIAMVVFSPSPRSLWAACLAIAVLRREPKPRVATSRRLSSHRIDPTLPQYSAHSQRRGTTTHLLLPRIVLMSLLRRRRLLSPSAIVNSLRQIPSHPREHNALSLAVGIGSMLLLLTSYLPAPFLRDLSKEREDASRPAKN